MPTRSPYLSSFLAESRTSLAAAGIHEHGFYGFVAFDTATGAEHNTFEWGVDEPHRYFGLTGQTLAETAQQRTATHKMDTRNEQIL